MKLRINKNEKKKVNEKKKNNKTLIDYYIIVLFSKKMVSHNELYILLTEQKQTKNMDRETRDLEKHLQRTPRKKDNQVISNLFFMILI